MKIKIIYQGKPIVDTDSVHIKAESNGIIAVEVDMKSKYCAVSGHATDNENDPVVMITYTDRSLFLDDIKVGSTDISIVGYKGWAIFTSEITRYTLRICLIKMNGELHESLY